VLNGVKNGDVTVLWSPMLSAPFIRLESYPETSTLDTANQLWLWRYLYVPALILPGLLQHSKTHAMFYKHYPEKN